MKTFIEFIKDNAGEVRAVIVIILAIVIGAILTGAIAPSSIANIVNTTASGGIGAGWTSSVKSSWDTIPVLYAVAFFLVPVVVIVKYLDMG